MTRDLTFGTRLTGGRRRRDNVVRAVVASLGGLAVAAATLVGVPMAASAAPAEPAPVPHQVTADHGTVIQEDFLGIGVNLIPTVLMENNQSKGYDEALWQIDRERILRLQPKVARVWFQVDWIEQEKGVYDFDNEKMQAFYLYLDTLREAGTEIELNFGWKNGREIHDWYGFEGVNPRVSAPQDLEAFGDSASALLDELLNERGYDNVKYLSFYNEPGHGYDYVTPPGVSTVMHYERMARAVHDQLVEDDLRDSVKMWGPEEWQSPGWTEYMARVGGDFFDLYTFHVYGGTYATLSDEIQKRASQTYGGEVGLTEFGFSGRYDSRWDAGYGNYVIKLANEGVKVGLIWQLNGVWLEDPDEQVDTNSTYTLWDSLAVTDTPNQRYYEAGPLMRYVPGHSTVVKTETSSGGVRAATFVTETGDVTMVVEVDDTPLDRALEIDLGIDPQRPVSVIEYSEEITPDSSATLTPVARTHEGREFTDTVAGGRRVLIYTTLAPEQQLTVTPDRAEVEGGEQLQLEAGRVDASGAVEWSVDGGGSVSAEGLYTAPAVEEVRRVSVTARLAADDSVIATSVVTVVPASTADRAELPSFSAPPGDYLAPFSVELASATEGAVIHYTTDGSTPTAASPVAEGPITLTGGTMLSAIAVKDGLDDSAVRSGFFRVTTHPTGPEGFTYCARQSQICGFDDIATVAEVAYGANGSYATGVFDTRVACDVAVFGIDPAPGVQKLCFVKPVTGDLPAKPAFTPLPGEFFEQTLTIEMTIPEGAEVFYTANGSLPTTGSTKYTGGPVGVPTSRTIKAIAVKDGVQSPIALATYTITDPFPGPDGYVFCGTQNYECDFDGKAIVAYGSWGKFVYGAFEDGVRCHSDNFDGQDPSPGYAKKCYVLPIVGEIATKPSFEPGAGRLVGDQAIAITAEAGATIHYTRDGSDPTTASPVYTEPIQLTAPSTTTIRALAVEEGKANSMIAVGTFTLSVDPNIGAPDGYQFCAGQHYGCTVTEPASAAFGANGNYIFKNVTESFTCNAAFFGGGDPAPGVIKKCYLGPLQGEEPDEQVAAPVFSPDGGSFTSAQSVTLSTSTADASIRYTLDGSAPTAASTLYTGPITVSATTTVRAIALRDGWLDSPVATATFTIGAAQEGPEGYVHCAGQHYGCTVTEPASAAFGANGNYIFKNVTESFTCNAAFFGGGDPAPGVIKKCYLGPLQGEEPDEQVAAPVFSPDGGSFTSAQSVTLSTSTADASIRYTLDGSAPTAASTLYTGPITVSATTTVRAIALRDGWLDSSVATATFTIAPGDAGPAGYTFCANQHGFCEVDEPRSAAYGANGSFVFLNVTERFQCNVSTFGADPAFGVVKKCYLGPWQEPTEQLPAPLFSHPGGTFTAPQTVSLASEVEGTDVRFTLDGSVPTAESPVYTQPITVETTTTITAIASKNGFIDSDPASATYTITLAAPPTPTNEDELTESSRGGVEVPSESRPGTAITLSAGSANAGERVHVWLHSTPRLLTTLVLDADGRAVVHLPADAPLGAHRVVLQFDDGSLLGWAPIKIVQDGAGAGGGLAATGAAGLAVTLSTALALLMLGAAVRASVARSRRRPVGTAGS